MTRRRMVVLPDPDGPISVTRSPLFTVKLSPSSTTVSPNRFSTSSNLMAGTFPPLVVSVLEGKALFQSADKKRCRVAGKQEDDASERDCFDVLEVVAAEDQAGLYHLDNADHEEERRLLEHRDRVVAERGHRGPHSLGNDHGDRRAGGRH